MKWCEYQEEDAFKIWSSIYMLVGDCIKGASEIDELLTQQCRQTWYVVLNNCWTNRWLTTTQERNPEVPFEALFCHYFSGSPAAQQTHWWAIACLRKNRPCKVVFTLNQEAEGKYMVLHGDYSAAQVSCTAEPKLTAPSFCPGKNLGHDLR